jgi:hypothetical protein
MRLFPGQNAKSRDWPVGNSRSTRFEAALRLWRQVTVPLNRSLDRQKESPIYARKVSLCLKSESVSQFLERVEHEVIPMLHQQKGFLDQLILVSDNGKIIYVYSFWENSGDAEQSDCTTLPVLTRLLTGVVDGALRVHTFGGLRGRLSSGFSRH